MGTVSLVDITATPPVVLGVAANPLVVQSVAAFPSSIVGALAHDAVDTVANRPVKVAGYASDVAPASVGVGDVVNLWATLGGALMAGMQYNGTLPTVVDTKNVPLQSTDKGMLRVSGHLFSNAGSDAVANSNLVNFNNQTTAAGGSLFPLSTAGFVFNESTYDRMRGSTNGISVQAFYNSTLPAKTNGQTVSLQAGTRGSLNVTLFGQDSSSAVDVSVYADNINNSISSLLTMARGAIWNGGGWDRAAKPNATARLLSAAASTNATSVKASAGNLHKIRGCNTNVAKRYLKFYNKASSPTVGSDTPVLTFELQPSTVNGGEFDIDISGHGHYFSTGIAYALTTAAADADTGALTAGDITSMNVLYS
jgi:hypothetical protein